MDAAAMRHTPQGHNRAGLRYGGGMPSNVWEMTAPFEEAGVEVVFAIQSRWRADAWSHERAGLAEAGVPYEKIFDPRRDQR